MVALAVLYMIVCLTGIVGNGVALAVYVRKTKRPTPQCFIIGLAFIDLFVCLVIMPYGIVAMLYPSFLILELCKLMSWLWHASISSSIFITAGIAVDRYFAVCKPLTFRVSPPYARVIVFSSMAVSLILSFPVIFLFGIAQTVDSSRVNTTSYSTQCTVVNPGYAAINVMSAVIFTVLVTVVTIAYGSVYTRLRRRARVGVSVEPGSLEYISSASLGRKTEKGSVNEAPQRVQDAWKSHQTNDEGEVGLKIAGRNTDIQPDTANIAHISQNHWCAVQVTLYKTKSEGTDHGNVNHGPRNANPANLSTVSRKSLDDVTSRTTKMLLLVTITFIVTWMPYWVFVFLPTSFWESRSTTELQIYSLLKYLYVINNAINPIIYSFVNKNFRQDSLALFITCFNNRRCNAK